MKNERTQSPIEKEFEQACNSAKERFDEINKKILILRNEGVRLAEEMGVPFDMDIHGLCYTPRSLSEKFKGLDTYYASANDYPGWTSSSDHC